MYYLLKDTKTVKCKNLIKWAQTISTMNRTVAKTKIRKVEVSTVFLGLDHSFDSEKPLLFETMVFGGKFDGHQERYTTWEKAKIGHDTIVKKIKSVKNK